MIDELTYQVSILRLINNCVIKPCIVFYTGLLTLLFFVDFNYLYIFLYRGFNMTSNLTINSKSLNDLQYNKYIEQGKGTPIGLIKFIDKEHINDLVEKNIIYFRNLKKLVPKSNNENVNIRRDKSEGSYCFKNKVRVEIEDVMKQYQIQTYSTSFTLVFDKDFDNDKKLKKEKVTLLKELEKYGERRPFVTIDFSNFYANVKKIQCCTPRLVNRNMVSPKINNKTGEICGGDRVINKIKEEFDTFKSINKGLKEEAKKQLTTSRKFDSEIIDAFSNSRYINSNKNEEDLEDFVLHGGFVYYNKREYFDPFTKEAGKLIIDNDKLDIQKINKLSEENKYNFFKKLIECCITFKDITDIDYSRETEYRLLISNFSFNKKMDGISLNLGGKFPCCSPFNFNFRKYEFCDLEKLKKGDFSESNDLISNDVGEYS